MNVSRKILGFALAVTVFATSIVPAFAADPTGAGATANILDYMNDTIIVPTKFAVALNPHGYTVNRRYVKTADTSAQTGKIYYSESGGVYSRVNTAASGFTWTNDTYYEAETSADRVISLNYGIMSKASKAMDLKVDFQVTTNGSGADGTKAIEFVDNANDATEITAGGSGTAKTGETKMYLAVKSANAVPTATTYAKYKKWAASDAASTVFYTLTSGKYTKVGSDGKLADETAYDTASSNGTVQLYTATTAINENTTADELADVNVSAFAASGGGVVPMMPGTHDANASVAYLLEKANRQVKDTEDINMDTTQVDLANMLEVTSLTGYTAFTITGTMNDNCDWTQADTKAITITPIYKQSDSDASETPVTGTAKQVTLAVAPSADATQNILEAGKPADVVVNLGTGTKVATGISGFVVKETGRDWYAEGGVTYANGKITIPAAYVDFIRGDLTSKVFEITFNDADGTKVEVTLGDKN